MQIKTYIYFKRTFDIVFSLFCLIVLSPVMLVTLCSIFLMMGRPIFFKQLRPGKNGKIFVMYKFRTMQNCNGDAKVSDEERVTLLGKFLRKCSIDELPEFWNVLRGDMSVVGPRPLLPEYLELYSENQARRHKLRPGITGWAQINGRNAIDWEKKFELDVWYIDNLSAAIDFKILLRTVRNVIMRSNIGDEGGSTCKKFEGNA